MRAKVTWRVPRWSGAQWAAGKPGIRDRYGDDVGEIVEMVAHMAEDRRERPSAQDIKHTLQRIVAQAGVDLRRVDGYTEAVLATVALQQHRTWRLRDLTPQQLADCALLALQRPRRSAGAKQTDDLALMLVKALLGILPGITSAERVALLHDALLACGLGAGQKTIERLLAKVRAG